MSNLGFIDAVRGDDAGAQAWYERAIAIDPTYPHVHRRLADLFYDRKDWAQRARVLPPRARALPPYFEVLIQAGNAARFLGDLPTAAAYYEQAGKVASGLVDPRLQSRLPARARRRPEEAPGAPR